MGRLQAALWMRRGLNLIWAGATLGIVILSGAHGWRAWVVGLGLGFMNMIGAAQHEAARIVKDEAAKAIADEVAHQRGSAK